MDLIAAIFGGGKSQFMNRQTGGMKPKRNVTLIDDTFKVTSLGFWSEFIDALNGSDGRAALFLNLQLREYKGKLKLSKTKNTIITCDSERESVLHLNSWFGRDRIIHNYEELN